MVKKVLLATLVVAALLCSLMIWRALPADNQPVKAMATEPALVEDAAQKLAGALQIPTVSRGDERAKTEVFTALHDYLEETFPAAHQVLVKTVINERGLMYYWPGKSPDLAPVGFSAQLDVIPVRDGAQWQHPPFAGKITKTHIWGRGALDGKAVAVAMLQSVDRLAAKGYQPTRDVYLLFGHDKELEGTEGAFAMAEMLKADGVRFDWMLAEGTPAMRNAVPGVDGTVAFLSVAEKGRVTIALTAKNRGLHTAAPSDGTAASLVARAGVKIVDNPYPAKMDSQIQQMLHKLADRMSFEKRLALRNLWLTGDMAEKRLAAHDVFSATMHTTSAVSTIEAKGKSHLMPAHAEAIVNFRVHPRDRAEDVLTNTKQLLGDPRVSIRLLEMEAPSPYSATDNDAYAALEAASRSVLGAAVTVPSLTLQRTDLRHFAQMTDNAYRIFPFTVESKDLALFQGRNERIATQEYARMILFYEDILSGL